MDDIPVAWAGGKARERHGKADNAGLLEEDVIVPLRDPETGNGSAAPSIKAMEVQGGSEFSTQSSRFAGGQRNSGLVKLFGREGFTLPCSRMTPRLQGLVLLNLVMLACASTFVVLKEGQENFDPFVFSSLRFLIAAAAFSPFLRRATQDERTIRAGLEIGVWAAGGYLTQSVGMVTADASRGAFLSAFTVVVVPVLAGVLGTATMKRMTWVSVGVALFGVMLLEDSGAPPSWGDFWNFASAVLFGVQIYRTEYWSKQCGSKHALPMMAVALVMISTLSIVSMLLTYPQQSVYLLQHPRALEELISSTALPWTSIVYMGVFVTDLGLWAEVIALQYVSSTEASIIYTLEPVCGAAFAYVLLNERWGMSGWIGAVLIVVSCLGTQLVGAEKE